MKQDFFLSVRRLLTRIKRRGGGYGWTDWTGRRSGCFDYLERRSEYLERHFDLCTPTCHLVG